MESHSLRTSSGGNSIRRVEMESGCFSISTFIGAATLRVRRALRKAGGSGAPSPDANFSRLRRHSCPRTTERPIQLKHAFPSHVNRMRLRDAEVAGQLAVIRAVEEHEVP